MEKLIGLLNKYAHTDFVKYEDWCFKEKFMWEEWMWYSDVEVISKDFWFIQWLEEHSMLNITKIDARIALSDFNVTDRMLMALAISDNPIELLIDCLKQDGETY